MPTLKKANVSRAGHDKLRPYYERTAGMNTQQTPYQIMGEEGIKALCNTFYDLMDTHPEFSTLRAMHSIDLLPMKIKLAEYLTGWMGGPPRYADKYGTVCMTSPHEHYHIGPEERDQWLLCMDRALVKVEASEELTQMLKVPLYRIADAVRNREGPSAQKSNSDILASN